MQLPSLVRIAGWFRIVCGVLAMIAVAARDLAEALRAGGVDGRSLLGLLLDVSFGGVGVLAGFGLHKIAKRIENRDDFTTCVLGLVLLGMCAFCDCGWLASAPIATYVIVRLTMIRSEFH